MKKLLCGAALLAAGFAAAQAPAPVPTAETPPAAPQLTQPMIRDAVHAVLAEEAKAAEGQPVVQQVTIRADKYEKFAAAFSEAKVPDCLHEDGLKRQPTNIGPIGLGGILALPFVAVAKLRGKCN
jgi:opacity protein-like surface antigen